MGVFDIMAVMSTSILSYGCALAQNELQNLGQDTILAQVRAANSRYGDS